MGVLVVRFQATGTLQRLEATPGPSERTLGAPPRAGRPTTPDPTEVALSSTAFPCGVIPPIGLCGGDSKFASTGASPSTEFSMGLHTGCRGRAPSRLSTQARPAHTRNIVSSVRFSPIAERNVDMSLPGPSTLKLRSHGRDSSGSMLQS